MKINAKNKAGLCSLKIEGEMTIMHANEIKQELLGALAGCVEMEINLSEVSEIDTAGFQLLVMVKREAINSHRPLRLVGHSAATLELIDLYNMAAYFGDPVVISSHQTA